MSKYHTKSSSVYNQTIMCDFVIKCFHFTFCLKNHWHYIECIGNVQNTWEKYKKHLKSILFYTLPKTLGNCMKYIQINITYFACLLYTSRCV